ncbi:MAG: hypothetical protein WD018_06670 [Nitrosopumilaceae archaeon]
MPKFIYGLDPASKNDYFGIVIHELVDEKRLPKLRFINKITHTSFDKMYEYLLDELFVEFPPYYIVVDYTNEKTFSDLLVRRYGDKVELIRFSNTNKNKLKDDGLAILKQGYKFPNYNKINNIKFKELIQELIQQLKDEQIVITKSGKISFDHPSGKHNDLAIAWELSVHGCQRFMLIRDSPIVVASKKFNIFDEYDYLGTGVPRDCIPLDRAIYFPGEGVRRW